MSQGNGYFVWSKFSRDISNQRNIYPDIFPIALITLRLHEDRVIVLLVACAILICGCTTLAPTAVPGTKPGTSIVVPVEKTIPHLIGVGSGNATGHTKVEGFAIHLPVTFNISAQKGQAFSGRKEYLRGDGKTYYENFSGFITPTGEIYESDEMRGVQYRPVNRPGFDGSQLSRRWT
jgi:hypothetical protein